MVDDWGDIEPDDSRMARRAYSRRNSGPTREQRYMIGLGVVAAVALVIGLVAGFAFGRATAPKVAAAPAPVVVSTPTVEATTQPVAAVTTPTVEATTSVDASPTESVEASPTEKPDAPKQIAPDDGAKVTGSKVTLKWSKVSVEDGAEMTYSFEIQTKTSSGKWGTSQVITGLTATSYKARVLSAKRRWRVWAVTKDGRKSEKSDWSSYSAKTTSSTTSNRSTTTSGTAH